MNGMNRMNGMKGMRCLIGMRWMNLKNTRPINMINIKVLLLIIEGQGGLKKTKLLAVHVFLR